MATPTAIPVSLTARSARHPQTPPQRALLGSEPMSSILGLQSPVAPSPLLVLASSATSSKPRRIVITPAPIVDDSPRCPGGSAIERVRLLDSAEATPRRSSGEAILLQAQSSVASTLRPSPARRALAPVMQGHVDPLHPTSPAAGFPRRPSDEAPAPFPFPNSLHLFRDRDIPPSPPQSIRGFITGETTIKAGSMARHLHDLQFILRELGSSASSVETTRPTRVHPVVDELEVEWCVRCGRARARDAMALTEVVDQHGRGPGVWWVCKAACGDEVLSALP